MYKQEITTMLQNKDVVIVQEVKTFF